jgi:hypothetical protein
MRSVNVRAWVLAAVALSACVGTWASVVHADDRLLVDAGLRPEPALRGVCWAVTLPSDLKRSDERVIQHYFRVQEWRYSHCRGGR